MRHTVSLSIEDNNEFADLFEIITISDRERRSTLVKKMLGFKNFKGFKAVHNIQDLYTWKN